MRLICKAPAHEAEMEYDEPTDMWACPEPGCTSAMEGGAVARHESLFPDDEVIVVVPEGAGGRSV